METKDLIGTLFGMLLLLAAGSAVLFWNMAAQIRLLTEDVSALKARQAGLAAKEQPSATRWTPRPDLPRVENRIEFLIDRVQDVAIAQAFMQGFLEKGLSRQRTHLKEIKDKTSPSD